MVVSLNGHISLNNLVLTFFVSEFQALEQTCRLRRLTGSGDKYLCFQILAAQVFSTKFSTCFWILSVSVSGFFWILEISVQARAARLLVTTNIEKVTTNIF